MMSLFIVATSIYLWDQSPHLRFFHLRLHNNHMEIPVSYYLFVAALHNFGLGNQIDDNIDEKPPKEQKE